MDLQNYLTLPKQYPFLSVLDSVTYNDVVYPIYFTKTISDPTRPTLVITGGCHGLEKIGVKIVLRFLEEFNKQDNSINLVCIPCLNPYGLVYSQRSNGNGVDLMRNAPTKGRRGTFFLGGQSWTSRLPYYSGSNTLEYENTIWLKLLKQVYIDTQSSVFITDVHSGFGAKTFIWPANSSKQKRNQNLFSIFERIAKLNNMQSEEIPYAVSGDMFDYLYDQSPQERTAAASMEIGVWEWILKFPWRSLSIINWFNPPQTIESQMINKHVKALLDLVKII